MKQSVFLAIYLLLLAGCSTYNRIQIKDENGTTSMRLNQFPEARRSIGKEDLPESRDVQLNLFYLYEQKEKQRPEVTLSLKSGKPVRVLTDSVLFISLGSENIELFSLEGRYMIPENLWISIVHSPGIHYKLMRKNEVVMIELNEGERDKLVEFFKKAIKHRENTFPVIPEGQKKW